MLLLSLTFAFVIVVISTFLSVPVLLYGLDLQREGWNWVHVALFSSMVASTDAVAGVWGSASHHHWGNYCRHGASTAVPSCRSCPLKTAVCAPAGLCIVLQALPIE